MSAKALVRLEGTYLPGVRCRGADGFRLTTFPVSSISNPDGSRCSNARSASC
jgi:hypothetical protein